MSRPPIKAFEAVKKYCEKTMNCVGCPLYREYEWTDECCYKPMMWNIKKGDKRNEID